MAITVKTILKNVTKFLEDSNEEYLQFQKQLLKFDSKAEKVAAGVRLIEVSKTKVPFYKDEKCAAKAKQLLESGDSCVASNSLSSALRFYTESIAKAPSKSEALAAAYANRSLILHEMGHLEECLGDIERAFVCGYPPHLAFKVFARRGACLQLMGKPNQARQSFAAAIQHLEKSKLDSGAKKTLRTKLENDMKACKLQENELPFDFTKLSLHPPRPELPPLSFGPNIELPSVSEGVDLQYNKELGRHLVANRDIQLGDVVMVDPAYVAHVYPKFCYCMCNHCGRRSFALLPCENCSIAMFCSLDCKAAAAESHTTECRVMFTLTQLDAGSTTYNLVKLLCKTGFDNLSTFLQTRAGQQVSDKRTAGFTDGVYDPTDFNTIFNLQHHAHKSFCIESKIAVLTAAYLVKVLGGDLPDPYQFGGLILHLFCCLSLNGTEIKEVYKGHRFPPNVEHDVGTGVGIHPTYCLVNHSCDPNLRCDFFGYDVVLRAIQPIKKGTQVTIAYHYRFTYFKKPDRQILLSKKNDFSCKCDACKGDWPLLDDMPLYPKLATPEDTQAYKLAASQLQSLHDFVLEEQIITPATVFRFSKHVALLDSLPGGHLCWNYTRCQKVLEQFWARLGNYYIDPYF